VAERRVWAMSRVRQPVAAAILALAGLASSADAQPANVPKLTELSLDELANLEVISVSRRAESLADAPAAILILTAEDIRRSGATSLAEALRLAPNLQVARSDATQYAISARGFNNIIANKLLIMVDGRTIYTPLFSGVFWDQQDVLLEDVERIEIISGPGATLWGANAVNGVINIITRSARDTLGALVSVGGGNEDQNASLRYGRAFSRSGHVRVYGKAAHVDNTAENTLPDSRRWLQGGFRADWGNERADVTLQGDAYTGRSPDRGRIAGYELGRVALSGGNLLGRFTRRLSERSGFQFQAYFDHYKREERILFQPDANLFDVEFQHDVRLSRHRLVWGTGYRHGSDDVQDGILVGFRPTQRSLNWENVFAQDEIQITNTVAVSAGVKLERNDYTGWEYLPSTRLAWKASSGQLLWGAVSRAVRAPARLDRDVISPFGTVLGGPNFESEVADVFELGYRGRPTGVLTTSVTAFLHQWDKLRSGTTVPVLLENRIEGPVYGVEAWTTWQVIGPWRLSGGATAFRKRLRLEPGSTDPVGTNNPQLANDPGYQWLLRSSLNFWSAHTLDTMVRHVGKLPNPSVPAYTSVDARYGWRARPNLELSVKVEGLFDRSHPEFGRNELERRALLQARWSR